MAAEDDNKKKDAGQAEAAANGPPAAEDDDSPEAHLHDVELKASLGLIQGCTVIIGSIIGSGIFISPGGVLMGTGSINLALLVWLFSGIYSMIGAYCYAELGCMIRKAGGDYIYIYDALGPFIAFMRLWAECLIVRPCTITIVALTFAKYAVKPFFPACEPPDESVRLLAAVCICESLLRLPGMAWVMRILVRPARSISDKWPGGLWNWLLSCGGSGRQEREKMNLVPSSKRAHSVT